MIDNCSVLPWPGSSIPRMCEAIVVGEPLRIVTESNGEAWPGNNVHDELNTVCASAEIVSYVRCYSLHRNK